MKLSKNLGRIATTFLATAMLAAFAAVPASAETVAIDTDGTGSSTNDVGITEITFDTQLFLPDKVAVPTASYTFTFAADTAAQGGTETVPGTTIPVLSGNPGTADVTPSPVEFNSSDSPVPLENFDIKGGTGSVDSIKKVAKTVTIDIGQLQFTDAGVYKYKLTESAITSSELDQFTQGTTEKTVYLYVQRKDGAPVDNDPTNYVVTDVVLKDGTPGTGKTAVFNNAYKLSNIDPDQPIDPDRPPEATANELKVNNTVAGVMGNKSDLFTYTITITSSASNKTYTCAYEKTSDSSALSSKDPVTFNASLAADGKTAYTATVYLAHDEQFHIYGLSNGETYTVAQTAPTDKGYKTTIGDAEKSVENGTYTDKMVTVSFTNTRNAIAPTGLVMNVAPYVLLVLVAAGAGYVFLRKREED